MSLTAIRNGIYRTLTACGPYSVGDVSTCSFDVLEATNGGSAIVFLPLGTTPIESITFGGTNARGYKRNWRIGGTLYIRDTGNPQTLLGAIWQGYDDLYNTLSKDDSFNGSAAAGYLESISHRAMNVFIEAGGHIWKPIDFSLVAEEF